MIFGTLKGQDKDIIRDASTMVLGGVIWDYFRNLHNDDSRTVRLGLSMALGGGLNNYMERRKKGYVTDYVSLNVGDKRIRKIVFNISDLFIFAGAAIWGYSMIFSKKTK